MRSGLAKRICLLVVLMVFWLPLQGGEHGLLFEVSRPGESSHYLLGTMHSDDPRVIAVLDRIRAPMSEVKQVVLEILPDAASMVAVSLAMLLPAEQELSDLVGPGLFRRAVRAAGKKGLPEAVIQRMQPWALAITLGTPELRGKAMEQVIQARAMAAGRQLRALETPAEQLALFQSLPWELQTRLLKEVLDQQVRFSQQLEALTRAYLDRDLDRLRLLSLEQQAAGDAGLAEWFRDKLILERNRRMVQRLRSMLDEAPTLVAVGALHLPGKEGLVTLLRNAGYRVEPLF